MIPDTTAGDARPDPTPRAAPQLHDDDYTLFGLPQRQALDTQLLDARWRQLQARVHPDRFVAEGAAAQRVAMQWAVRVNEAYRRLKDPLQRAAYLCELRGAPVNADSNTAMPGDFLLRQMEWREALDDAADAGAVERIAAEVATSEAALQADVQRRLDADGDAAAAVGGVRALMFVGRFRQDIERRRDAFDASGAAATGSPADGAAADF